MFTDAARDSIAKLDLLGSRLAVFSQDVAWDFSDPTSPDYTAARKAWFENELKATWQTDPPRISQVNGVSPATRSAAPTPAGISYTPIRDGGAGDEINGIATGGSFAYVWKDNDATSGRHRHPLDEQRERRRPRAGGLGRHAAQGVEQLLRVGAAQRGDRR